MTEAQLRSLVAVAETGSFRAAAQRLHMSQPGVSRAIKSLETELGGPLFARSSGSAGLTALGERALVRGRAILAEADAMRQERDEQHGIARGRVRLGSMPSVSAVLLPGLLSSVGRRHPGIEFAVIDGHDDELVEWVRTGTVDAAVVAGDHAGLVQQPLATDEMLAVLPSTHRLAEQDAVDRRELKGEPFILTRAGCEKLVLAALAESGVVPDVQHEVSEASSILALVSEGFGVSVMPRLAAPRVPGKVVLRPLCPAAERRLSLATAIGRLPGPATRAFLAEAACWKPPRPHMGLSSFAAPAMTGLEGCRSG